MQAYMSLSDEWWRAWLSGERWGSPEVQRRFDLEAAPEPYLSFAAGDGPLVVLTTNPGATMPHQRWTSIASGASAASSEMPYATVAEVLADYYCTHLDGPAARRITGQLQLAQAAGFEGVLQVECCPWHSPRLPDKSRFLQLIAADEYLARYTETLKQDLAQRAVLAISAVSSKDHLNPSEIQLSPWLSWQCELMSLDHEGAEFIALVVKEGRITSAALVDRRGHQPKVLVLMMGGNHLPSSRNRHPLIQALTQ